MYLYAPLLLVALLLLFVVTGCVDDIHNRTDEFERDYHRIKGDSDGEE